MNNEISLSELINILQNEEFDFPCFKSSLFTKKIRKMYNIIKQLKAGGKVNLKEWYFRWYVWFDHDCKLKDPLYDEFRFNRLDTNNVQMTISIDCCLYNRKYVVLGRREDGEFDNKTPLFKTNDIENLINWFNTPWEE